MISIPAQSTGGLRSRLRAAAGAAVFLMASSAAPASAQGFGPDPFKPFNSQYEAYVYPISPGPLDPVASGSLNRTGVRGANHFNEYLQGVGATSNRYDQLYRSQISGQRQAFRPTAEADARFENQQNALTTLYFKYIRERDPVKRASLLKAYNNARKEAAREVPSASRAAVGRKAEKPKAGGDEADAALRDDEPDVEASDRVVSPPRRTAGRVPAARSRGRAVVPPPPPITGGLAPRTSPRDPRVAPREPAAGSRSRNRTPSDVLDRAVESERDERASEPTPAAPSITP